MNKDECCPRPLANVVTVQNIKGMKKYSNSFVRVLDLASTFFVDRQHRVTPISVGIAEVEGYDVTTNLTNFRNQLVFDTESETMYYFSNSGQAFELTSSSAD